VTSESIAVTLQVIDVLEALGVPYAIGGSLASALHGMARATLDSDLVADLQPTQVPAFVHQLQEQFYVDEMVVANAIQRHTSFNLIHLETMFKVDIFIPKERPFDQAQLARRQAHKVATDPERTAYVASAEDTILAKLEWYRLGGEQSERQWRDIRGVVQVQGDRLDYEYVSQQAAVLGVTDLWQKMLSELSL